MRTSCCLLGLLRVDFVARFAAFFRDGQYARPSERLQRIRRLGMNHPHAKPHRVADVHDQQCRNKRQQNALGKRSGRDGQAHSLYQNGTQAYPQMLCVETEKFEKSQEEEI